MTFFRILRYALTSSPTTYTGCTCSDLTPLKDRNKIGSFIVAKTSLCSKKTGLDIAMNFKYCRLPSKEKERGYTVVII
jgi:hypothetical protein